MDQSALKTSWKQRLVIIIIAALLLFSTIATYIAIVLSNGKSSTSSSELSAEDQAKLTELQTAYTDKQTEINDYAATLSSQYFDTLKGYKSEVKAYNSATANSDGLTTVDLQAGTGRTLEEGDTDYFAYYIGWCADESIFDSSFNDSSNPTSLGAPLSAARGLIDGWNKGVVGMKLGGVRELSIPGELAYGESQEICGGTNSPLKFIVLPMSDDKLKQLNSELDDIQSQIMAIYYGTAS